ncbi:GNAT family N-acetyltransferase [Paraclostridium ghonii]|uniref:GNAT family N-acetyltransferase n=1 Tax=Paraclostridium ghonii TaxID=29358 RepID=UPI0031D9B255
MKNEVLESIRDKDIITDRLILRKFNVDDARDMFKNWASDSEVTKFLQWEPHINEEFTKSVIETWIREYETEISYHWAIEFKETKEVIGEIYIFNIKHKRGCCEIGTCISRRFWNNGISTEAIASIINCIFKETHLSRIIAMHDVKNIASKKVILKSKMKYEGEFECKTKLAVYSISKKKSKNYL